jgi:hypothetical protein
VGGRLNSRLINAPRLPVAFFYMYGLLQMLFPLFQATNIGLSEVTSLTHYGYRLALLAGKTILADVMAWAVLTRRLEFFHANGGLDRQRRRGIQTVGGP